MSTPPSRFANRRQAGRLLADALPPEIHGAATQVLALPRGGVPVAYEIARALQAPLDVFVVRKLGVPGFEEYAMGAIATGGVRILNREAIEQLRIPWAVVERVTVAERRELERRERLYRGSRPPPAVRGHTVIVVDDGLATGATMLAAVAALRGRQPARIVVAVPLAAPGSCDQLRAAADEVICLTEPDPFEGVGRWYDDFHQTSDEEVRDLLEDAARRQTAGASSGR